MKYLKIGYYFFKENLYYRNSIVARSIFLILLCILLNTLVGMGVNFDPNANIGGIEYKNYIWYVWITELIIMSSLSRQFFREILSGEVINYLTRPINFLYLFWGKILGSKLVMIGVLVVVSFPIILILNNFNFVSFQSIVFLIAFLIGISISIFIDTIVFLIAFWLENATFLRIIFQKIYFIFGGLFFPLSIYPSYLQLIAENLPFKYALQFPAKIFVTNEWVGTEFYKLVLWGIILVSLNFILYFQMIKRLEINGG